MKNFLHLALRILLSAGVSLVVLALLMGLVGGQGDAQERPRLLLTLRRTVLSFVGLYFVLSLFQAFFRAVRYRLLIRAAGEPRTPGLFHTYLVTLTRNMLVDLLPARLGELSYIGMMNKGYDVSGKACVSSLGISFLFDFIALLFVIAAVILYQLLTAGLQTWLVSVFIVLACLVLAMGGVVFAGIRFATDLLRRILGGLAAKGIVRKMLGFVDSIAGAIETTRRAGVLRRVLLLSLGVRGCKYLGLFFVFRAVAAPNFPELAGASFGRVLCSLLSAEAGASVPIPSFMSFGTYEAGGTLALTAMGFPAELSKVAMLAMHIWSQCCDYLLGGAGFITFLLLTGKGVLPEQRARTRRRPFALAAAALVALTAGAGFLGWEYRKTKKMGAARPPPCGHAVQPSKAEAAALRETARSLRGFVVWSSNRSGNHEILMRSFPDLKTRALTSNPHVDYFPRISPDGKRIVFARSQLPWVSQRNAVPWDVYLLDLESGAEQRIAAFGNTPDWSADGRKIYFDRKDRQFIEFDLETQKETILFESGKGGIPDNVLLQTPSFSQARNAMAVTLRGGRRGTGVIYKDGRIVPVGGGCQLTWATHAPLLYYVDSGGRQKNVIYAFDPEARRRTPLLDLPGSLSHEYFPKMSRDGSTLVCGASTGARGQHEHDTSDYEIFLWKQGTPPEQAVRVTYHTGNDCWPDLYLQ